MLDDKTTLLLDSELAQKVKEEIDKKNEKGLSSAKWYNDRLVVVTRPSAQKLTFFK